MEYHLHHNKLVAHGFLFLFAERFSCAPNNILSLSSRSSNNLSSNSFCVDKGNWENNFFISEELSSNKCN